MKALLVALALVAVMAMKSSSADEEWSEEQGPGITLVWHQYISRVHPTRPSSQVHYRVDWGRHEFTESCTTQYTGVTFRGLVPGNWRFRLTEVDPETAEATSPPSNIVEVEIPGGELRVLEGENFVYTLQQTTDRLALVPVGTVPVGTLCLADQAIRDANGVTGYVVPRDLVEFAGTVEPRVVVAKCG